MELRSDIATAASRLASDYDVNREVRRLGAFLRDGETVARLASGMYGAGAGLLAITDHRVLFLRDGLSGQASEGFPLGRLTTAEWVLEGTRANITVSDSTSSATLRQVPLVDAQEIIELIRTITGNGGPRYPSEHPRQEPDVHPARPSYGGGSHRAYGTTPHLRPTMAEGTTTALRVPTGAVEGTTTALRLPTTQHPAQNLAESTTSALRIPTGHPESTATTPGMVRQPGHRTDAYHAARPGRHGGYRDDTELDPADLTWPGEQPSGRHGSVPVEVIASTDAMPSRERDQTSVPRQQSAVERSGPLGVPVTLLGEVPISQLAAEAPQEPEDIGPAPTRPAGGTRITTIAELSAEQAQPEQGTDNAARATVAIRRAGAEEPEPDEVNGHRVGTEAAVEDLTPEPVGINPAELTAEGTQRPKPISWQPPPAGSKAHATSTLSASAEGTERIQVSDLTQGAMATQSMATQSMATQAISTPGAGSPEGVEAAQDDGAAPSSEPAGEAEDRGTGPGGSGESAGRDAGTEHPTRAIKTRPGTAPAGTGPDGKPGKTASRRKRWIWLSAGAAGLVALAALGSAKLITANTHNEAAAPVNPAPAASVDAPPAGPQVTITKVVSSDRVEVSGPVNGTVVVLGILSPKQGTCGANDSTRFATKTLENQSVTLVSDPSQPATDKAGRKQSYLRMANGGDYSTLVVRAGMAKYFDSAKPGQNASDIKMAQSTAKEQKEGLWGTPCNGKFASSSASSESSSSSSSGSAEQASTGSSSTKSRTSSGRTTNAVSSSSRN